MVEDYFEVSMSQNEFNMAQIQSAYDKGFEVRGMIPEYEESCVTIRFKYCNSSKPTVSDCFHDTL